MAGEGDMVESASEVQQAAGVKRGEVWSVLPRM